jgi:ribosomal protein S18 acetylase RimI-like enzyme
VSLDPNASVIVVGAVDAGILLVERLPHEVQLHILYLLPSFQGLGIGSALVSSLQREAAERRVPLRLKVLKVNPAKRLYERMGFSVEEETEHFFCMQNAT